MKSYKLTITLLIIGSLVVISGLVLIHGRSASAQNIPPDTYFKDVQRLSEGNKPACLKNDKTAEVAVTDLDKQSEYAKSFNTATAARIPDIPAGYTDTRISNFENNKVTGTIVFNDKNQKQFTGTLNSFNYSGTYNPTDKSWKVDTFVACD